MFLCCFTYDTLKLFFIYSFYARFSECVGLPGVLNNVFHDTFFIIHN